MNWLYFALALVVCSYIGFSLAKSAAFLRKCSAAESGGCFAELTGSVVELIDEKKSVLDGKAYSISYPRYVGSHMGKDIKYNSVVRRQVSVGDSMTIRYDERSGFVWAKGDMELMKRQILVRVLILAALLALLTITGAFL